MNGLRIGLPEPLWEGLERQVEDVARAALNRLEAAGVVFVPVAMSDLDYLNAMVGGSDCGARSARRRARLARRQSRAGQDGCASWPRASRARTCARFTTTCSPARSAANIEAALNHWRPRLQQYIAATFADQRLDALLFPTTRLAATPIDDIQGSSTVSIDGAAPIPTMNAFLRNTDPASTSGIPGLSLAAGMTASGLPVGLELDGPLGEDRRLLAIGVAFEQLLGVLPAPVL